MKERIIPPHDPIELRSNKVKQLLDEIPSMWLRYGTVILFVIFAIIIIVVLLSDYPYGEGETIFEHIFF